MKKICLTVLTICLALVMALSATSKLKAETKLAKSETIAKYTNIVETPIMGGATLYSSTISTYNGRRIDKSYLADHNTYWVTPDVPVTSSGIRVVNYTMGTVYNWEGARPTSLAKKFESEHPGWIVLAGINGDFFHISDNCEPSGTSMQEGDFLKPYEYKGQGHAALGFYNDGTYIYGTVQRTANEFLKRLKDDGSYEDIAEIKSVDGELSATGINLLTRFKVAKDKTSAVDLKEELPYDLTEYKVAKITYTLERYDRNTKKVFVKGLITEITSGNAKYTIDDAQTYSYVASKDGSLDKLVAGDEVKCECNLTGDWAGVTNITGAYNEILKDGNVVDYATITDVNREYVNCSKNRTVMGFKADGTPVIMVIEKFGSNGYGASYEEAGEILKSIGCVNGYLFDGGGSSTIYVKNADGSFRIMNKTEDGSERSDANSVFLVAKDPGFRVTVTPQSTNVNVNLKVSNAECFSQLSNVSVTVNGKTDKYNEAGNAFDGLKPLTDYTATINYDMDGQTIAYKVNFKTTEYLPEPIKFTVKSVAKESVILGCEGADGLSNIEFHYGDESMYFGTGNSFEITGLEPNKSYEGYFTYDQAVQMESFSQTYKMTSGKVSFKTLEFNPPVIETFEEKEVGDDSVSFRYKVKNEDSIEIGVYLVVNGEEVELESNKTSYKLKDLNLEEKQYKVKLVVKYAGEVLESNELTYGTEKVIPTPGPDDPKPSGGCNSGIQIILSMMAAAFVIILLKKHN